MNRGNRANLSFGDSRSRFRDALSPARWQRRLASPARKITSKKPSIVFAAAVMLAGCSIHPEPEDFTGVTTYQIARQIRCEMREAAKGKVLAELRALANEGDLQAQQVLARYDGGGEDISTFTPEMLSGPRNGAARAYLTTIYATAVAYSFDLTMDETNNLGTTIDLLGPWASKLTLGVTADANRERSNEQVFTLTDTLGGLLLYLNVVRDGQPYCGAAQIVVANYAYPITGQIGVAKTLQTFFDLQTFTTLAPTDGTKTGNAAQTAPTYTEKLIFTTTVDLSATPKITFAPGGSNFQFMDASFTGLVRRVDTHKVYIGLAEDPSGTASLAALQKYVFPTPAISTFSSGRSRVAPAARLVFGNSVIANARTPAEALAVQAVDQVRSREIQIVRAR